MTQEEVRLARAYYSFSQSPEGQIVLKDLRERFYERTLVTLPTDPNSLMLNVGMREVVVYILAQVERLEYENGRNT